ncbi:MAG: hypothetical protein ACYSR3_13350 [Planctomycetota bacterium]|jgi:hypothetical protein
MIARNKQSVHKQTIKLLPQEKEGNYKFNGRFVATPAAIDKFGQAAIVAAHIMLLKEVKKKDGLDYLQVFDIDGEKLWFIDDVGHFTCLLPSDY